jgi:hypothetical protein
MGFLGRQNTDRRRRRRRPRWLLLAAGLGALVQYLRDPQLGGTRRARLKDQAEARVRRPLRAAQEQYRTKAKIARDQAAGLAHDATTSDNERTPADDRALVDKARSGEQPRNVGEARQARG